MAFCNVNQFKAKKLIKSKNITTIDQVERTFKSSAYFAWNMLIYMLTRSGGRLLSLWVKVDKAKKEPKSMIREMIFVI